ncbi:MAG: putative luciferase-like monooxygenase, partial [Jatrophihabitantaceae bacterium]|nr:putative luciferase-like monooxygenase [Jatrophihabitantaceae bacterium]
MSPKMFHLAWFLNQGWGPGQWQSTWRGQMGKEWYTGKAYIDLARRLESAGFDYLLIEDSNYTAEIYGGNRDAYLRAGYSTPKLDATVLAAAVAQHTSRLGIAATMSTTEWNPYMLARHMQSLDQISNGRAGWNIVTGGAKLSAANMGYDDRLPHAERYARADEFTDLVRKLWNTWEHDALITDLATKSLV